MAAPGTQVMQDAPALLIRQRLDKLEMFCPACQKRNKYKMAVLQNPTDADFTEKWTDDAFKAKPEAFVAKESSTFCCRFMCMNKREFEMDITTGDDQLAYKLFRPFKWAIPCCCTILCPERIELQGPDAVSKGYVEQDFRCVPAMCGKAYWKAYDASGAHVYTFQNNICCNANMFAPSCCCPVRHLEILDKTEQSEVGSLENIFPGCNCRSCGADSYKLTFPQGANADEKALLVAGTMLIEYMLFERSEKDS